MLTYIFPLQKQTSILSSECVNLLYCSALSGDLKRGCFSFHSLDFDFILYLPPAHIYPQNQPVFEKEPKGNKCG